MFVVKEQHWIDDLGREWSILKCGELKPGKKASHAALRRFVFIRDGFTCQHCAASPRTIPEHYSGWQAVYVGNPADRIPLELDHVHPRCAGGSHHPDNIQALCRECNGEKGAKSK